MQQAFIKSIVIVIVLFNAGEVSALESALECNTVDTQTICHCPANASNGSFAAATVFGSQVQCYYGSQKFPSVVTDYRLGFVYKPYTATDNHWDGTSMAASSCGTIGQLKGVDTLRCQTIEMKITT